MPSRVKHFGNGFVGYGFVEETSNGNSFSNRFHQVHRYLPLLNTTHILCVSSV